MDDDVFWLPIDDVAEVKHLLETEGPYQASINGVMYIVIGVDEDSSEIELQFIDEAITYH